MDNYDLKDITKDSSGNKYLKVDDNSDEESPIIDTFDNKVIEVDKDKELLIEKEKLLMENKKLKEEFDKVKKEIIPRLNTRLTEIQNENQELLYENSLLRKRLMQVDYNPVASDQVSKENTKRSTQISELSSINDDDHLISSSKKDKDVTSYDPFELFSNLIILFSEIKNILKKLSNGAKEYQHSININEQETDDLLFYKSIILDSKKFYVTSHKIRKNKLVYDMNEILKMFNYPNMPNVNEINKTTKGILKKYYIKLAKEVKDNNDSINKPIWIKNNKHKYIETIKREMNRTFLYHIDINNHYRDCLIKELGFYKIQ